uniref:Uncharacterized protein n=1 Tax=Glossina pallidipes TaxID=7398 RepID=A0A1A9ZQU9_GLOPL
MQRGYHSNNTTAEKIFGTQILTTCGLENPPVVTTDFNYNCRSKVNLINNEGCGKNGSTVADAALLSPSLSLTLPLAANVTNKLVIAHMTKTEMEYLD